MKTQNKPIETTILEIDRIPKQLKIGQKYHCSWASSGCVWVLKGMGSTGIVLLETPKTKKQLEAKASDLRLTNADALAEAKKRIEKRNGMQLSIPFGKNH